MTKKRYHKLFRALMTKMMSGYPSAGRCIRAAATADPINNGGKFKSYAEAWESLKPIRDDYGM